MNTLTVNWFVTVLISFDIEGKFFAKGEEFIYDSNHNQILAKEKEKNIKGIELQKIEK